MKIEFVAYAVDCVGEGTIELESDRLADLLTEVEEVTVEGLVLESVADSHPIEAGETTVAREELCIVVATGPRGSRGRRVHTRPQLVRASVGPYDVSGYLHAPPTADAFAVARRRAVIPLTDAVLRFELAGVRVERRHEAVLLNRDHVDWFELVHDPLAERRRQEVPVGPVDPNAKDMTGDLYWT